MDLWNRKKGKALVGMGLGLLVAWNGAGAVTPEAFARLEEAIKRNSQKECETAYMEIVRQLPSDPIIIHGRVTDTEGRPVVGAEVSGEAEPDPSSIHPIRKTTTKDDGTYELTTFAPYDLHRTAGYLNGGDPTEFGQFPFYVRIRVKSDGFVQDSKIAPRVPRVTEELLVAARRYLEMFRKWAPPPKKPLREKTIYLPTVHGRTITGIDVVLMRR